MENTAVPAGTPVPPSVPVAVSTAVNEIAVPCPIEHEEPVHVPADGVITTEVAAVFTA